MENATKALLIAAAVLIVIILIALGVSLLNSAGDTTEQAEQVGGMLKEETESASGSAIGAISGLQGGSSSGGSVKKEINFTIYGNWRVYLNDEMNTEKITVSVPQNMTWEEFIDSTYNKQITLFKNGKFEADSEGNVRIQYGTQNIYIHEWNNDGIIRSWTHPKTGDIYDVIGKSTQKNPKKGEKISATEYVIGEIK